MIQHLLHQFVWRMRWLGVGYCLAVAASTLGVGAAVAQDAGSAYAERGPQFLVALSPTPVRVDVRRTPMLRQRISINLRGVPLAEALRVVSEKSGVHLAFSDALLPERAVDLRADNITVAAVLTELLLDAQVDILFSRDGRGVLVRRQAGRRLTGSIVGRVTDARTGGGLAGAAVLLEKTRWQAATDTSGRYRLVDVDTGQYTLTVRRLGYAAQHRAVTVRSEQTDTINFVLEAKAVALDELVTTATGRQRRRDIGNAITTIKADSVLRTAPIRNLTDLLENRVPGMSLQHTSGAPGDPARIRFRGLASVVRGNDPVVVIDGIRVYSAQSEVRSGNLTNLDPSGQRVNPVDVPAPSPLDQIDPNIIEKVEIFKGPSAATMYGADAANGVIVITTKRGKPGPTRWQGSFDYGRTSTVGRYPTAYFRWGHDIFNGTPRFCTLVDVQCAQDSLVRFQALNEEALTVLGVGRRAAASLTAAGGSQALTYRVTGTYADEVGLLALPEFEVTRFHERFNREAPDWMRRPHGLKSWSVSSNVQAILGSTADVTLGTVLSSSEQRRSTLEQQLAAIAGTYIDTINRRYYRPSPYRFRGYALDSTDAVLASYYTRQTASAINFTTSLAAAWRPRSWLTANGQAGVNVIPRDDEALLLPGLVYPTDSGAIVRGTGRALESTFNLQALARKPLRWGFVFETSVGANITSRRTNDLVASARGLVPGTRALLGARTISATDAAANSSVFGWYVEPRVTGQRFSLSTGIRLDGGSNYGTQVTSLLGLPKLNGSWVISEEPWFPFSGLFSSLRLRGAYGQAQVQPSPTDRLRLYTSAVDGSGQSLELTGIGNDDLRPERSVEFEGGFDADLLDSRVSLEFTAYRKTQVDALMTVRLPGSVNGGGAVVTNVGNIRNAGVEATARVTPLQSPLLTWSAEFHFTHNRNTVVKLGRGVEPNPSAGLVAGYPVGGRWARPILGFADENGDGVLQPQEIQVGDSLLFMGRLYPNYETSLFTNVALFNGALAVTAGFSYDAGAMQVDQTARDNWVLSRPLIDPSAPLANQAAVFALNRTDYGMMQTVSTFRWSSLSLNYRVPTSVARLLSARQLSIGLQGSNLGLHSTYRGKDPDVNAWGPTENIADRGQLPLPRTWQLSLHLDY